MEQLASSSSAHRSPSPANRPQSAHFGGVGGGGASRSRLNRPGAAEGGGWDNLGCDVPPPLPARNRSLVTVQSSPLLLGPSTSPTTIAAPTAATMVSSSSSANLIESPASPPPPPLPPRNPSSASSSSCSSSSSNSSSAYHQQHQQHHQQPGIADLVVPTNGGASQPHHGVQLRDSSNNQYSVSWQQQPNRPDTFFLPTLPSYITFLHYLISLHTAPVVMVPSTKRSLNKESSDGLWYTTLLSHPIFTTGLSFLILAGNQRYFAFSIVASDICFP